MMKLAVISCCAISVRAVDDLIMIAKEQRDKHKSLVQEQKSIIDKVRAQLDALKAPKDDDSEDLDAHEIEERARAIDGIFELFQQEADVEEQIDDLEANGEALMNGIKETERRAGAEQVRSLSAGTADAQVVSADLAAFMSPAAGVASQERTDVEEFESRSTQTADEPESMPTEGTFCNERIQTFGRCMKSCCCPAR